MTLPLLVRLTGIFSVLGRNYFRFPERVINYPLNRQALIEEVRPLSVSGVAFLRVAPGSVPITAAVRNSEQTDYNVGYCGSMNMAI